MLIAPSGKICRAALAVMTLAVFISLVTSPARPEAATLDEAKAYYEKGEHDRAINIWVELARAGNGTAFFNLAQSYRLGQGSPIDHQTAKGYFAKGGLAGHRESLTGLATLLYFDDVQATSKGEAIALWQVAGHASSAEAQYMLSVLHYNGEGVPRDVQLAYAWADLASEKGVKEAEPVVIRARALLSANELSQAQILKSALEGPPDFTGLKEILEKWAARAPLPKPRKALPRPVVEPRATRTPIARPAVNPVTDNWRLQVGAFSSVKGAEQQLKKLADLAEQMLTELKWVVLKTERPGNAKIIYRLQIGPFKDRAAAEAKCAELKALGEECFVIEP